MQRPASRASFGEPLKKRCAASTDRRPWECAIALQYANDVVAAITHDLIATRGKLCFLGVYFAD